MSLFSLQNNRLSVLQLLLAFYTKTSAAQTRLDLEQPLRQGKSQTSQEKQLQRAFLHEEENVKVAGADNESEELLFPKMRLPRDLALTEDLLLLLQATIK